MLFRSPCPRRGGSLGALLAALGSSREVELWRLCAQDCLGGLACAPRPLLEGLSVARLLDLLALLPDVLDGVLRGLPRLASERVESVGDARRVL